jgi:hypothetical protein
VTGAAGLLELYCAHRGTSLEFGLICEQGLWCCYHGWLFDVDGKMLETLGEPLHSRWTFQLVLISGALFYLGLLASIGHMPGATDVAVEQQKVVHKLGFDAAPTKVV